MSDALPPAAEPPRDDDVAAAEYVLGVTGLGERAEAELRRRHDRPFDRAVTEWEERFSPLIAAIPPVEPSGEVWPRIEHQILPRPGLLGRAGFWRGATAASLALAAASIVVMVAPQPPKPPPPAPQAPPAQPVLTTFIRPAPGKTGPVIAATLDRGRGELVFTAASIGLAANRSAELWVIPAGQKPQSLGVIEAGQERRMAMPAALGETGRAGAVLAVTAEKPGGSPTGDPQGPVVATGTFKTA